VNQLKVTRTSSSRIDELTNSGRKSSRYRDAGVDIDRATQALDGVKELLQSTHLPGVLRGIGSFGALLHLGQEKYADPVLVMSVDGVGTKLKIAFMTNRHDTVGQDLVNHCVDDILVQGAKPIAFMDYFATGKLEPLVVKNVLSGLVEACKLNSCSLVGGETAEMPDFYREGEYDLAGCIVGIVEKDNLIDGTRIAPGDTIIGLPSTGLHTNGYTLARKIVFESAGLGPDDNLPGTDSTVADMLLRVHRSYYPYVIELVQAMIVKGMIHITGGGFYDNIPRVMPQNVTAIVDATAWTPNPLFRFLEEEGEITKEEMYRVFNMGMGFLLIVADSETRKVMNHLRNRGVEGVVIGRIEKGGPGLEMILP
jgi:phosphoribosylformylglycinamidine cyclo-ligase